ncbi:hypothetical protein DERP_010007 [Dermatophagoides pteronyssinus]|uniref:Uncharacterized protein n=1 Tax=Dermatophagoides pteronyssinus TaxID=6956 RepID=A0ABQ8J2A2_DERPT|nr:hypothetical protein DERP_010007 [Dermatophagoides pteronyssinus]
MINIRGTLAILRHSIFKHHHYDHHRTQTNYLCQCPWLKSEKNHQHKLYENIHQGKDIALHSTCQPGRPFISVPFGNFNNQYGSFDNFAVVDDFHNAKSFGERLPKDFSKIFIIKI